MGWAKIRGKVLGTILGGLPGAMVGSTIDSQKAEEEAAGKQQEYLNQALERADPFWNKRQQFGTQLEELMKNPASAVTNPYGSFITQQGIQAIERSGAAKGLLGSPQMALELQKYGQASASETFQQQLQNLATLSGANVNPAGAANVISQQGQVAGNAIRNESALWSQLTGQLAGLGMQAATMGMGGGAGMFGGMLGSLGGSLFGGSSGFTQPDVFSPGQQLGTTSTIDPGGIFSQPDYTTSLGGF